RARGALPFELPPRLARLPLLALEGSWAEARALELAMRGAVPAQMAAWFGSLLAPLARAQGDAALAGALVAAILPAGPATQPGEAKFFDALVLQRVAAALALDACDLP